jgi:hypothetical protein
MRRIHRIVFLITLAAALPALSGCADFDPDKLDVFGLNEKKKLPGDRKELFPEGVPGVSQGIPPEYVKGSQPAPDTAQSLPTEPERPAARKTAAAAPAATRKRRAKAAATSSPKSRTTAAAPSKPVQSAPDPAFDQPAQQQPAPQQPAQSNGAAPWPNAAPAPNTFSR